MTERTGSFFSKHEGPGAGTYEFQNFVKDSPRGPKFPTDKRLKRNKRRDELPGPGYYDHDYIKKRLKEYDLMKKSFKTRAILTKLEKNNKPGPTSYNSKSFT